MDDKIESEKERMNIEKKSLRLYGITDDRWLENQTMEEVVEELITGGITCLQYRDKTKTTEEKKEMALRLKTLCDQVQIPFIINDDVELAELVKASGVHLGQKDCDVKTARKILGEEAIIGVSARTVKAAVLAQENGADYLGTGAVLGTATKEDACYLGVEKLTEICRKVSIPVVAIGGISMENIPLLKGSYVSGVAVVSGLFQSKHPLEAAQQFRQIIEKSLGEER